MPYVCAVPMCRAHVHVPCPCAVPNDPPPPCQRDTQRGAHKFAGEIVNRVRSLLDQLLAVDTSESGALTVEDFAKLLRKGGGKGLAAAAEGIDDTRAARMHARADVDGDGRVDFNELVHYMAPHQARKGTHKGAPGTSNQGRSGPAPSKQVNLLDQAKVHLTNSLRKK